MPSDPISQSIYPHHFDSRDDGRVDTSIDFVLSDTFRYLEEARSNGTIDSTKLNGFTPSYSKLTYSNLSEFVFQFIWFLAQLFAFF